MIKSAKSRHGGRRPNAGRKPDASKDLATGASTALKILAELKHEDQLKKLYETCGDTRLQASIIFRLREWAYGKPSQPQEIAFSDDTKLRVVIEHIGTANPTAT